MIRTLPYLPIIIIGLLGQVLGLERDRNGWWREPKEAREEVPA